METETMEFKIIKRKEEIMEQMGKFKQQAMERIGEHNINIQGLEMEIITYNNAKNIEIKIIKHNEILTTTYSNFKKGLVYSKFYPTIFEKGIVGYEEIYDNDGNILKSYTTWVNMFRRCYSFAIHCRENTYIQCEVCDEWIYYSNFKKWFNENYYEVAEQRMELDKDILIKNNKIYSPQTCIFAPNIINQLFKTVKKSRGLYPIGVCRVNNILKVSTPKFIPSLKKVNSNYYVNLELTKVEEAFLCYKHAKEQVIKDIADYYINEIPKALYDALYKYEVYIDD